MKINKLLAVVIVAAFALPVMAQNAPAMPAPAATTAAPAATMAAPAKAAAKPAKKHHAKKMSSTGTPVDKGH
ncbi:hypothetical protein [Glaciimonas immobilis]|uniref:Ribosomal protein L12E/L44/L45/RPP1/RPP2 n=1 Tax=Glaciimonas immobilis TaxID=728004 RepID=A0A840RP55_9BURK|nr:hypothetical protein [Glaciimonas immobilis]KAF3997864.1 hypothetical protein HAV38_09735 [Glaciimonas immobilis]MBB5199495.1 ribosomal protein L12E/L44/L45/RPP1/RPP2 [Glaciimonas immobilis]